MYCTRDVLHEVYKTCTARYFQPKLHVHGMLKHGLGSAALREDDAALDCTAQLQTLTIGLHVISISAACTYASQAHIANLGQQGVSAK